MDDVFSRASFNGARISSGVGFHARGSKAIVTLTKRRECGISSARKFLKIGRKPAVRPLALSLTRAKRDKGGHCASVRETSRTLTRPGRRIRSTIYVYIYACLYIYSPCVYCEPSALIVAWHDIRPGAHVAVSFTRSPKFCRTSDSLGPVGEKRAALKLVVLAPRILKADPALPRILIRRAHGKVGDKR